MTFEKGKKIELFRVIYWFLEFTDHVHDPLKKMILYHV